MARRGCANFAGALLARGIGTGDHVGVMATNSVDFVVLLFAIARIGAILVPVNPEFGAEIDSVVSDHPAVVHCAVIPVPCEPGEDDILVAVIRKPGANVSVIEIANWCLSRPAEINVPRNVAFVDSLPQTATHRVAKFKLRSDAFLLARATDLAADAAVEPRTRAPG